MPPLRERCEDVPLLLAYFLKETAITHRSPEPELTAEALARLTDYSWPGNVRELKNVVERLVLRPHNGRIGPDDLPVEIWRERRPPPTSEPNHEAEPPAQRLFQRMLTQGESFWMSVYEPFMARDLTRDDLRELVRLGLEHTRGNYKMLVACFNMPPEDYKRFMSVLRKHQCHLPFQRFRVLRSDLGGFGNGTPTLS